MTFDMYTNAELIRIVDNTQHASELERALANRLDELQVEINMLSATMEEMEEKIDAYESNARDE